MPITRMTPEEARALGIPDKVLVIETQPRPRTDPRDPRADHEMAGREPIFRYHNCARCQDGEQPCVRGNPRGCGFLHAKSD